MVRGLEERKSEEEKGCVAKVTCALLILLSGRPQWQTQVEDNTPTPAASLDDNIMLSCRVLFYRHPRVHTVHIDKSHTLSNKDVVLLHYALVGVMF